MRTEGPAYGVGTRSSFDPRFVDTWKAAGLVGLDFVEVWPEGKVPKVGKTTDGSSRLN
ncbi:MAG TPA: hypothetical protein VK550_12880 [Polyangiaceae bacterium]|nr:hypothetical protein [Polyangiaceae bacterium]